MIQMVQFLVWIPLDYELTGFIDGTLNIRCHHSYAMTMTMALLYRELSYYYTLPVMKNIYIITCHLVSGVRTSKSNRHFDLNIIPKHNVIYTLEVL